MGRLFLILQVKQKRWYTFKKATRCGGVGFGSAGVPLGLLPTLRQRDQLKLIQREWRPYLATKREVLALFEERGMVSIRSLMEWFDYTYNGAKRRLYLLHKEGLIEPLFERGTWGLTQKGERRLIYYEQRRE